MRKSWFRHNALSLSLAWGAAIQCFPTHSNNSLSSPSVAGYASTTPLLDFASAPTPARRGSEIEAIAQLTGPFKILAVDPSLSDSTPDDRPLADKLLYMDLPNDMPGPDAHCRVSVARCKPCTNPHDTTHLSRHLSTGLTQYVLSNYTTKSPPFDVTTDDVSVPVERLKFDKISSHRSARGRGEAMTVPYEAHRKGLLRPSWERESNLLHSRQHILEY